MSKIHASKSMSRVKEKIKNNIYLLDCLQYRNFYMIKHNIQCERDIRFSKKFGVFPDLEEYGEFVHQLHQGVKKTGRMITKYIYGIESLSYGHLNAFFDYAGISCKKARFCLPYILHGVPVDDVGYINELHVNDRWLNCVYMPDSYTKYVHAVNPLKPVFCVGPYIHYPPSYLSEEALQYEKAKNGKTLVVFPTHDWEFSFTQYDEEKWVNDIMNQYSADYQTIIVCAYWLDIDRPVYKLFKKAGAKIASAGFRENPDFIRKVKSIILLADDVAGTSVGTHIGYCMHLKKPYAIMPHHWKIKNFSTFVEQSAITKDFEEAFHSLYPTEEEKKLQSKLYHRFWGGDELVKTKEEIRAMIDISKDMLKRSKGNVRQFGPVVLQLLREYSRKQNEAESVKLKVLQDALPQK